MTPLLATRGGGSAKSFGFSASSRLFSPSGAYDSLATVTLSTTSSTITFAGIPQTGYQHLQIRASHTSSGSNYMRMRFNGDSSAIYSWHNLRGRGSDAVRDSEASTNYIITGQTGPTTLTPANTIIDILDHANNNKYKSVRTYNGYIYGANSEYVSGFASGNYMSTNPVTSIELFHSGVNFHENTEISLYGIR